MFETIQPKISQIGYPMFFPSVGSNAAATTATAAAAAEADKKVHRTK